MEEEEEEEEEGGGGGFIESKRGEVHSQPRQWTNKTLRGGDERSFCFD